MTNSSTHATPLPKEESTIFASRSSSLNLFWKIYDFWVMSIASPHLWGCPSSKILDLYSQHVSSEHLEAGVGTGYFLDRCRFPVNDPSLTLLDVSQDALEMSKKRLSRFRVSGVEASLLEPLPFGEDRFGSVGMNYVLHCIPGSLRDKMDTILKNLLPCMKEGGVLFGSTILGKGVEHNLVGSRLVATLQANNIFRNQEDDLDGLREALERHTPDHSLELVGRVGMFIARKPRGGEKRQ